MNALRSLLLALALCAAPVHAAPSPEVAALADSIPSGSLFYQWGRLDAQADLILLRANPSPIPLHVIAGMIRMTAGLMLDTPHFALYLLGRADVFEEAGSLSPTP